MMLPRFHEPLSLPIPALSGAGVQIVAEPYLHTEDGPSVRVVGVAACPQHEVPGPATALLQRIALVVYSRGAPHGPVARAVAGGSALFSDDVERRGGLLRAVFEVDLFQAMDCPRLSGRFFVHACVGRYLSPVMTVDLSCAVDRGRFSSP